MYNIVFRRNRHGAPMGVGIITAAVLFQIIAGTAAVGEAFTILKSYGVLANVTGIYPQPTLVQAADGNIYGTTWDGEGDLRGALFKMQPDGSGFTVLKFFRDNTKYPQGQYPGNLVLDGGTLYGTAGDGTTNRFVTVFKINTDGTQFSVLRTLNPYEVGGPTGLLLNGTTLYGTTGDTTNSGGRVFRMNVDGTGFTVLKTLQGSDGRRPLGKMALTGSTLYGTTSEGGESGNGTLFKLNTDGSDFSVVREFDEDGRYPYGALLVSGNTLYGVSYGRPIGYYYDHMGVIFRVNTDGTGYGFIRSAEGSGSITMDGSTLYGTWTDGAEIVFRLNTDGSGFQILKTLNSGVNDWVNLNGILFNGGTLYGVTSQGGSSRAGTIFRMNPDGNGYAVLKNFGSSDAQSPQGSLALAADALYGTTSAGGKVGGGTLFKLNKDGSGYTVLTEFDSGASYPYSIGPNPVLVDGSTVYGTTSEGGSYYGTIYKVNTDGTGFTVLKELTMEANHPNGRLVLAGNTLYGTTSGGGPLQRGTVFKITRDGTGFEVLRNFNGTDGEYPRAGLVLSGNALYGTASDTLFRLTTDGSDYTVLKKFSWSAWMASPTAVVLNDGWLYGMAYRGDTGGPFLFKINTDGTGYAVVKSFPGEGYIYSELTVNGQTLFGSVGATVFQINTDGTGYFVWKSFTPSEGWGATGSLVYDGRALYGATARGGEVGSGTLFRLALSPFISSPPSFLDGAFRFTVSGPTGQDYVVQAAANPATGDWTTILRTNSPPVPFSFADPNAGNVLPTRFYRAVTGTSLP